MVIRFLVESNTAYFVCHNAAGSNKKGFPKNQGFLNKLKQLP
jgi:hypothetical protein